MGDKWGWKKEERWGEWESRGGGREEAAPRGFGDGDLGMRSGCAGGQLVWVVASLGRAGVAQVEVHQDQYRVILILFLFLWFFLAKRAVSVKSLLFSFSGLKETLKLEVGWDTWGTVAGSHPAPLRLDCCFSPRRNINKSFYALWK